MKVIVTGVSKGLGKALVQHYLDAGIQVIGIGRSHNFDHSNFSFIHCDFSSLDQIENLVLPILNEDTILFNNAGQIGHVQRLSDQVGYDVAEVLTVNTIAPMILSSKVANAIGENHVFTLVNISSGAGRGPIPSWSAYCASKAALDMFSLTFYKEEKEKGRSIKVYAVAPGVIDTAMQEKIRSVNENSFSSIQRFVDLKNNAELLSPEDTVNKILKLLSLPFDESAIICSLRDIN
jgi:benzil reductase ((S)-benzoin forming)